MLYVIFITNWADNPPVCCERGFLFCRQTQSGYTYQLLLQVDAHLTNFIADLRLRQADPLAISPASTTSQASIQQHSRLATLTLPLRLPDSCSEHASTHAQSSQTASTTVDPVQEGSGESQPAVAVGSAVSLGKPFDAQQCLLCVFGTLYGAFNMLNGSKQHRCVQCSDTWSMA